MFSDAFYSYNPKTGWEDLGPHPGGTRGFAQGDIMDRGTENETLYFGLGQTRSADEDGNDLAIFPRWGYMEDGSYGVVENATAYPRLTDWWSFDGQVWKRLADFPGIGRTHPGVTAENGKVFVGLGFGELCPHEDEDCTTGTGHDDPRGRSGNLQDLWIYDVATDTWEEGASFSYPVHHPMHFSANGQAYFVAGHNGGIVYNKLWRHNYLYNGTDSWTEMSPIPGVGRVAGSQFDHRGKGYILGGETASRGNNIMDGFPNSVQVGAEATQYPEDHRSMEKNEFWEYDGATDTWKELAPTPDDGSRWAGSSFVLDDYVYAFNGVIRKGHYHLENSDFIKVWPQQGYRMYIGPKEEDDDEEEGVADADTDTDTLSSGGSGSGSGGASNIMILMLSILLLGGK